MKIRFNRKKELWIPKYGIFQPQQIIEVNTEKAKQMIDSGYFEEVKVKQKKYNGYNKSNEKGVE